MSEVNRDHIRRDNIIFGEYNPDSYFGGCRRFSCSKETVQQLLDEGFIDPSECQNCSPTTSEFMEYVRDFDDVTFECYAISPDRNDYRITIEGVDIEIPDNNYDLISYAVETFHYADEFSFNHGSGCYFLHAWWD